MDEEKYFALKLLALKEHVTVKEILENQVNEYLKKHSKSNNPQTQIEQFDKECILAVPNLYRDSKAWQKFYDTMKRKKDFNEVDKALNMILAIHNKNTKKFD